jgi:hypothetical protein
MMATKAKTRVDRSAIGSNVRLTKALTHPLRVEIMRLFEQEPPAGKKWTEWSPVAVATELNSPIGNVSYHMRHLAELGFIRVGRTSNARGAVVHHYRKVARSGWDGLGPDGFEMELGILRELVTTVKGYAATTKVGILVDGQELVVAAGKVRRRVYPDGTVTDETNGSGPDGDK